MEKSIQDELLARVARLERQNTRLWGSLLAVAGLALIGAVGRVGADSVPETVEARRFVLKDEADAVRGEWLVQGAQGTLRVYGRDGEVSAELPLRGGMHLLTR